MSSKLNTRLVEHAFSYVPDVATHLVHLSLLALQLSALLILIAADMQIVCKHPITAFLIKDYHYKATPM